MTDYQPCNARDLLEIQIASPRLLTCASTPSKAILHRERTTLHVLRIMSEDQNLRSCFQEAELLRKDLDNVPTFTSDSAQDLLSSALKKYSQCLKIADQISLFSPNELLEDVSSGDLQSVDTELWRS